MPAAENFMADLFTPETLAYFIALFIPGFVIVKVWALLVPSKEPDFTTAFPNVISYSVVHYALTGWPLLLLRPPAFYVYAYLDVLVFPILWPIVILTIRGARGDFSMLLDARCLAVLAGLYRDLITVQPMPTPWDEVFRAPEAYWVRIRTTDGRWVGGRMLEGSHTSTYPEAREIFIVAQYALDQANGNFKEKLPSTAGLWVPGEQIATLELFRGSSGGKAIEHARGS
jgi:hypothetical protein